MRRSEQHIFTSRDKAMVLLNQIKKNRRIIFTNGCFDLIHPGHLYVLKESKALGDMLIVGLNTDDSVKRFKGNTRPINTWVKRAEFLFNLPSVDMVIGFDEDTPLELITALRPDVITKGGDYRLEKMIGRDIVKSYGGEIVILPFIEGYSTTQMIKPIDP